MDQKELVDQWIEQCELELETADAELLEITKTHSLLRKRLEMLLGLRASFGGGDDRTIQIEPNGLEDFELFTGGRRGRVKERVVAHTREVLVEAGEPLHISEIVEGFRRHGFEIPGKGEPVNIIAHLSKTDEVVSTGWGQYGLPEWKKGLAVS